MIRKPFEVKIDSTQQLHSPNSNKGGGADAATLGGPLVMLVVSQSKLRERTMNSRELKKKTIIIIAILFATLFTGVCYSITNSPLNITHYQYAQIIIDGKEYNQDIAIWPDGKITPGPEDMHDLSIDDFNELFDSGLQNLVVGTGDEGKIELDFGRKLEKKIKDRGIELIMMDTHDLVKYLNERPKRDFLVLVHLNC